MNVSELVVVLNGLGTTCPDARFRRGAARLPHILNGKFALDADSLWCLFVESMLRTILIRRVHGSSLALHQAQSSCGRGRPRGRRAMPT